MDFELPKDKPSIIKVIGVGGGGGNAVNHMYSQGIKGVDFLICNTDMQALEASAIPNKMQLGPSLTEGRGAGAIAEVGKNAALENIEEIREYLSNNTKMVFITAGMGGGTGTGAAPVIAQIAKELGILTVGIVTVPFNFEGRKRRIQAEEGLESMRQNVDTLLVINNERLREITGNLSFTDAFAKADDILATAAKGIAEVIEITGAINVDFNDVSTVMKDSGVAIMGSAAAEGDNRAIKAVEQALESPLLNDNDINGAEYVLLNITYGDREVMMDEISEITDFIQDAAGSTADVIFGHAKDETLGDKLSVTIIATGFNSSPVTGFEKAPEKNVTSLDGPKKEVTTPMNSATSTEVTNTWAAPVQETTPEVEAKVEETIEEEKTTFELDDEPYLMSSEVEESEEEDTTQTSMELSWSTPESTAEETEESEEEIKVYNLDEEDELEINPTPVAKKTYSPEELQQKSQERMDKVQQYTEMLRNPGGIQELENEPAFLRRNIQLDESTPSNESNSSRFSIRKDDNGSSLSGNNSFLHDNVD